MHSFRLALWKQASEQLKWLISSFHCFSCYTLRGTPKLWGARGAHAVKTTNTAPHSWGQGFELHNPPPLVKLPLSWLSLISMFINRLTEVSNQMMLQRYTSGGAWVFKEEMSEINRLIVRATIILTSKRNCKTAGNCLDHSHLVCFNSKIAIKSEFHENCVTLVTFYAHNE